MDKRKDNGGKRENAGRKPKADEIANCLPYLESEIDNLSRVKVVVALGGIAFNQVLRIFRAKTGENFRFDFKHLGVNKLGDELPWLLSSYHPSRQNTQTGRLTGTMFAEVWTTVFELVARK